MNRRKRGEREKASCPSSSLLLVLRFVMLACLLTYPHGAFLELSFDANVARYSSSFMRSLSLSLSLSLSSSLLLSLLLSLSSRKEKNLAGFVYKSHVTRARKKKERRRKKKEKAARRLTYFPFGNFHMENPRDFILKCVSTTLIFHFFFEFFLLFFYNLGICFFPRRRSFSHRE